MKKICLNFYMCLLATFLTSLPCLLICSAHAASSDVNDAVDHYEQYLKKLNSVSFDYDVTSGSKESGRVKRLGNNIWILMNSVYKGRQSLMEACVFEGRRAILHRDPNDERIPERHRERITGVLKPDLQWQSIGQLFSCPFALGFSPLASSSDYQYLPSFFRTDSTRIEKTVEDGHDLLVLHKSEGKLTSSLWLDPTLGYAARKLEVKQNMDKLERGKTQSRKYEITEFQRIADTHVPRVCDKTTLSVGLIYEPQQGKPVEKLYLSEGNWRVEFSNWQIDIALSEKDFALTSDIADGTEVYLSDAPQIEHIWLDGKIVPKTDEAMLAVIRGHSFKPGIRNPRYWLIAAGLIMIAVAGGLKIREFMQKRKETQ